MKSRRCQQRLFFGGAVCSIGLSLTLRVFNQKHGALFVGQWAPTLLLLGVYSKLAQRHSWAQEKTEPEFPQPAQPSR
jgi:hypothetical protein